MFRNGDSRHQLCSILYNKKNYRRFQTHIFVAFFGHDRICQQSFSGRFEAVIRGINWNYSLKVSNTAISSLPFTSPVNTSDRLVVSITESTQQPSNGSSDSAILLLPSHRTFDDQVLCDKANWRCIHDRPPKAFSGWPRTGKTASERFGQLIVPDIRRSFSMAFSRFVTSPLLIERSPPSSLGLLSPVLLNAHTLFAKYKHKYVNLPTTDYNTEFSGRVRRCGTNIQIT